jgi:hypothetical protein
VEWDSPRDTLGIECGDRAYARIDLTAEDQNAIVGVGRAVVRVVYVC